MTDKLKNLIELLPEKPGSYQMYDKNNEIIYIGKAKNLKKRVSQYFLRPQNGKTQAMVSKVEYFETIITNTEKEALILEMNLIQKYSPKYNILLKDDKHYPYIALYSKIKDPYIGIARNLKNKNCEYFGPFPNSSNAYDIIELLNSLYPLRKCSNINQTPCLYYHMGQCLAPCINNIKKEGYDTYLSSIRSFLNGENKDVLDQIKAKIEFYSSKLDFENANFYKKYYLAIEHINSKQNVELLSKDNIDVIGYLLKDDFVSISILIYRKGILIAKKNYVHEIIGDVEEFLTGIITQYYQVNLAPKRLIIGNNLLKEELKEYLEFEVFIPQRGKMVELLNIATQNAKESLDIYLRGSSFNKDNSELIERLGELLNIPYPKNIELYDNSHLQGTNAVGAMVYFTNGEPIKNKYRKFNITSSNTKDDLLSMKEVITRRINRLKESNEAFPDLIILDGGLTQLEAIKEVLEELKVDINLAALGKNDKHKTNSLFNKNGDIINLENEKELFFLLSRMQDEVHRYAISFHKSKRSKSMYKSVLDDIPGIGAKRKEQITKLYPTYELLKECKLENLKQILPENVAIELIKKIGGNNE